MKKSYIAILNSYLFILIIQLALPMAVLSMGLSFDFRMAFSFYPAFDKNTAIFKENLLGTWVSEKKTPDEEAFIIEKGDTPNVYILTLSGEDKFFYRAYLFELNNRLIFQMLPLLPDNSLSDILSPQLYYYMAVEYLNERLALYFLSSYLAEVLKKGGLKIKYLERDDCWLITDNSEKIRDLFYNTLQQKDLSSDTLFIKKKQD